jgi:hypothetical protein
VTRPLLSVCIATLNRGSFIGETLESIVGQATDAVEIVVLDGGSTDDTAEVVGRFASRAALRYERLDAPGGVDRDYDRTVERARGDYCWLMSDDDVLKPGAIAAVLKALAHGYALVVVNAEIRDLTLRRLLAPRRVPLVEDRVFEGGEAGELFALTGRYLSFIGAVVIRREVWLARDRERFIGSLFIHVGVIFQAPLPGPALVQAEPGIVIRLGNAQWTARAFEIWMFLWPGLVWSLPYSDEQKTRVSPPDPWRRPRALFVSRARGSYSVREFRRWLAPRLGGWRRAVAAAIAYVPPALANFVCVLYYHLLPQPGSRELLNALEGRHHYRRWPPRLRGLWRKTAGPAEAGLSKGKNP